MDSRNTQYLFKETRINLEPSSSSFIVNIKVPSPSTHRNAQRRPQNIDQGTGEDENVFKLKNIATASSVYNRKWHESPRSFLWRLLEDRTVLSIRAIDVAKHDKDLDAPLILNFRFAIPIQPTCISFADPREHDALSIFVLDDTDCLYSITLRPDYFRKQSAIESGPVDACKVYHPSVFGFKHPHRMVASSADRVVVALHDGGLVRLDRNRANDASANPWRETIYNSQSWTQGLRSLIPFQGKSSILHGKVNMDPSAATSVAVNDLGIDGASFLFTVCLDHRMRIWNLHTGQILFTGDILNSERNPQEVGKWIIDPSHTNLLQIVGDKVGERICATYSPLGASEFKFWTVKAHDSETIYVEDRFPDIPLVPASPSLSDVWTLTDFVLSSLADGRTQLWALWKNNMTYRVQELDIDGDHMDQCWETDWASVCIDTVVEPARTSSTADATDVTEKWLALILAPGRFTKTTLETALSIYERGLGAEKDDSSRTRKGLAESICSVIASTASLDRKATGNVDYEQFRASSEIQWRRFHRLLLEMDKQRGEAVSLVLDPLTGLTYVVCADALSAIRDCTPLERLYHNLSTPEEEYETAATLISTGLGFLDAFSDQMLQVCASALRPELFEETSRTDYERLQHMWDTTAFWRGISEEDCKEVTDSLGQKFSQVNTQLYDQFFDLLSLSIDARQRTVRYPLTDFGKRFVVKAAQDTVDLQWRVCMSQLLMLVHMEFDWEHEEDMLSKRVDVGLVFRQCLDSLRRLDLLRWLANTEVAVPLHQKAERSGPFLGGSPSISKGQNADLQVVTALEDNVGHLLGFADPRNELLAMSITQLVTSLCAGDSDIEVSPTLIQCSLIRQDRADLAEELTPYCDQTPFAVYVHGRISLALGSFDAAALSFRRAAVGMSVQDRTFDRHSSGLLDETDWNLLHQGPARFYCHVVSLFEGAKAYSYVIDFASIAIQFSHSSPEAALIRSEMLSRQFNAATATARFDIAHSSLLLMKDKAMRTSSLRKLLDKMCTSGHNHELTILPFPGLQEDIDEILAQKCQSTMDVQTGIPYHQILYSWRISHHDYKGAASVILDRIHKLRHAGEGDRFVGEDVLDTPVTKQYLLLINALSCVDPKQAWIFSEELPPPNSRKTDFQGKRSVLTLGDLRKQYQDELDRIAAIQNNQFGFEAGDDVLELL